MTRADLKRGWCPSLLRPMESGDGWLVRIRPRAAVITAEAARGLAEAAKAHGNGRIEITNRANLQVRGLRPETIAPFTRAMEAAGLAEDGPALLVSPLLGADPGIDDTAIGIAAALGPAGILQTYKALKSLLIDSRQPLPEGERGGISLPDKFGIMVDGGGALPLAGLSLDVTLRAVAGGWLLNGKPVPAGQAATRTLALACSLAAQPRRLPPRRAEAPALGFHPYGDGQRGAVLLAPVFGQLQAAQLAALGDLAERWGDGSLRPTPWKSLAIAGVARADERSLRDAAHRLRLIAEPGDPRLGIVTCVGAPACLRGEVKTHEVAASLVGLRRPGDPLLHLSGCAKGCAHPGEAAVTLIGAGGRLDLVRRGRPGDAPVARALTLAECAALMQSLPA